MAERDGFELGQRRLLAHQRLEFLVLEHALDRPDAVGPLGMARAVEMIRGRRDG